MSVLRRCGGGFVPTRFVVIGGLVLAVMALSCHPAVAQAPKTKLAPKTKTGPAPKAKPAPKTKPGPAPKTKPAAKPGAAEPYIELPVDDSLKSKGIGVHKPAREDGNLTQAQLDELTKYYTTYALPRWTRIADRADVQKYRKWTRAELQKAKGTAHDQIVALVLTSMTEMAKNNHHPVARVNAMLMIGELNQTEAITAAEKMVALPAALPVLLVAAEDPQLPDAVKVAALVGINRHAELGGVAPGQQKAVATVLLRLAMVEPVLGRSPASHAWIRALAIDTLGALKSAGPATGQVASALLRIAGDEAAPFSVRCAAARALGKLTYPAENPGVVPMAVVRQMAQLAVAVVKEEIDGHTNNNDPFVRRRLQARLIAVYNGLTGSGLAPIVTKQPDVAMLDRVVAFLKRCLETLENQEAEDSEVIQNLTRECDAILRSLEAPVPKAKPKED